jgi:hypothetical protein
MRWIRDEGKEMPFKTMMDSDARYADPLSHEILRETNAFARPIIERMTQLGYNPREVSQLISEEVDHVGLHYILCLDKYRPKEET